MCPPHPLSVFHIGDKPLCEKSVFSALKKFFVTFFSMYIISFPLNISAKKSDKKIERTDTLKFTDYKEQLYKQRKKINRVSRASTKPIKPKFTETQASTIQTIIDNDEPVTFSKLCDMLQMKQIQGKQKDLFIKNLQFFYNIDITKTKGKHKTYYFYGLKESPYTEQTKDNAFNYISNSILKAMDGKPLYTTYQNLSKIIGITQDKVKHSNGKPWINLFIDIQENMIDRYLNRMVKANTIAVKHGYLVLKQGTWYTVSAESEEAEHLNQLSAWAMVQTFNQHELTTPVMQKGRIQEYYSNRATIGKKKGYEKIYECIVLEPVNKVQYEADQAEAMEYIKSTFIHNYFYGAQNKRYPNIYQMCFAKKHVDTDKIKFRVSRRLKGATA